MSADRMPVDWAWLAHMATNWRSGHARDFPVEEQARYRASLGLAPTPAHHTQPANTNAREIAARRWGQR